MREASGKSRACRSLRTAAVLSIFLSAFGPVAVAQEASQDAEAREYFERGRVAFEGADYERALVYFRHAHRLSERPELQYNIGVAADRLQREDEALVAFERYLRDTDQPSRKAEVRERIEALRASIAREDAAARALAEATTVTGGTNGMSASDRYKLPKATIAGGTALAAIGVAGVTAMAVGLARDGSCTQESGGMCVTQSSATAWTYVYGAVGIAALAGSASWFAVSHKKTKDAQREVVWRITPGGAMVSGKF